MQNLDFLKKKTFALFAILAIAIAVPATVFVAQQQQEIRQRAAEIAVITPVPTNYPGLTLKVSATNAKVGSTITFTASYTGINKKIKDLKGYQWFNRHSGDGAYTDTGTYNHQYTAAGTFANPAVRVYFTDGTIGTAYGPTITITSATGPTPTPAKATPTPTRPPTPTNYPGLSLSVSPTTGLVGTTVTFRATYTGVKKVKDLNGYQWFNRHTGDGTAASYTSTSSTTHTYTAAGTFANPAVRVYFTDGTIGQAYGSTITITTTTGPTPTPTRIPTPTPTRAAATPTPTNAPGLSLRVSPTTGPVNTTVTFTATYTGLKKIKDLKGYQWFNRHAGDGTAASYTSTANYTHKYTAAGTFANPAVRVYFTDGTVGQAYGQTITITAITVPTATPTRGAPTPTRTPTPTLTGPTPTNPPSGGYGDNILDLKDYNLWLSCYLKTNIGVCSRADVNDDGINDIASGPGRNDPSNMQDYVWLITSMATQFGD